MTGTRNQPLTPHDIAGLAPSALALGGSDGLSQRNTYIPTMEVINGMRDAGFLLFRHSIRHLRHLPQRAHQTRDSLPARRLPVLYTSIVVGDSRNGS